MVGRYYYERGNFTKAYSFFMRSNAIEETITCLRKVMKQGYPSEHDLFVARLAFEVLIRNHSSKEGQEQVKLILAKFPEVKSPLMNSLPLILEAIEMNDFVVYKHLVGIYRPQLTRDPSMVEYIERVAKYYFNSTIKEENFVKKMMKQMFTGGGNIMDTIGGDDGKEEGKK